MKPFIGITVDSKVNPENDRTNGTLELNWNYAQRVAEAGGVPVLLPPQADPETVVAKLDGLMIPGGADIDPQHWGEEPHPQTVLINPERTNFELRLLKALPPEMPVLGICYGCQLINVSRGGSLVQHLPDHTPVEHTGGPLQKVSVEGDAKLAAVMGTEVEGKSYHHQAVGKVGTGLRVVAHHEDGTVEALEAEDRLWTVGVQWHPERTPDDPATRNLFRAFIDAAQRYAASKP